MRSDPFSGAQSSLPPPGWAHVGPACSNWPHHPCGNDKPLRVASLSAVHKDIRRWGKAERFRPASVSVPRTCVVFIAVFLGSPAEMTAQSLNPFGIPTPQVPNPAANVTAVPGSRAQGWLAQGRSEVIARHGIVATSDPLAAQAGLEILRRGGNAMDAAVAAGAVLDVTSQNDTGIGGDLFALVYAASEQKLYALNAAGWAPAGWTVDFFREELGLDGVPGNGVNAATVPGAIRGYEALLERFGTFGF